MNTNTRGASLSALLLVAACVRAAPDRPPPRAGAPPAMTARGGGQVSATAPADATRAAGGAFSGAGGHGLGHPSLQRASDGARGAGGDGAGNFAPLR